MINSPTICKSCAVDLSSRDPNIRFYPYHTDDVYCKSCAEKEIEKMSKHSIAYLNEIEVRTLCYLINDYDDILNGEYNSSLEEVDNISMAYGIVELYKKLRGIINDEHRRS